ncbi:MAG: hypothetical protein ACRD0U_20670 [Acidimicrobiales bacterium]
MAHYDFAKTLAADRQRDLLAQAAAARARRAGHPSVDGGTHRRSRLFRRSRRTTTVIPASSPTPVTVASLDAPADRTSAGAERAA